MENKETTGRDLANQNLAERNKLENARKEGRAKGVLITAIICLLLLLALGVLGYSLYNRDHKNQVALMENQKTSFMEQLTARDSMINDWLTTFDQIEKNLSMIKEKEKLLTVKSSSNTEVSRNRKEQIMEDIKSINNLIDENKKKIASLSAQLKKSGTTIKGLEEKIATLEATTKQYENDIAELRTTIGTKDLEIGQLNTTMVALNDTLTHKNEKITVQTGKLHQAFLASGTFKDLKAKGLLTKEGGFLGLGRRENLIGDFPDSLFTEIDVTQTKSIPVNSKSAKLITEHPTNSYQLIREGDNKIASIEIKDPQEFWKISKYAVVELIK